MENIFGFDKYLIMNKHKQVEALYLVLSGRYLTPSGRDHFVFRFENNYGASVVGGIGVYGDAERPWELAVIHFPEEDNNEYDLVYDTPITDDVVGYLTAEDVTELLSKIKSLNKEGQYDGRVNQ